MNEAKYIAMAKELKDMGVSKEDIVTRVNNSKELDGILTESKQYRATTKVARNNRHYK